MLASFVRDYQTKAPAAVATLERGFDDATAVLALPAPYRKRLRTTNGVERLNEEIRRRERVIRIFPNRDSVLRLVGALLMEQDEVWTTGKRYFDMTAYWLWRERTPAQPTLFQETPMLPPACVRGSTRDPNLQMSSDLTEWSSEAILCTVRSMLHLFHDLPDNLASVAGTQH